MSRVATIGNLFKEKRVEAETHNGRKTRVGQKKETKRSFCKGKKENPASPGGKNPPSAAIGVHRGTEGWQGEKVP